jgi:hypothetical protein
MAQQGRKIDEGTRRQILRMAPQIGVKPAARECRVAPNTARKYLRENRRKAVEL